MHTRQDVRFVRSLNTCQRGLAGDPLRKVFLLDFAVDSFCMLGVSSGNFFKKSAKNRLIVLLALPDFII